MAYQSQSQSRPEVGYRGNRRQAGADQSERLWPGEPPAQIWTAAISLWGMVGAIFAGVVVEVVAASAIVATLEEEAGILIGVGLADFMSQSVYFNLLAAVAVAVAAFRLKKGSNATRVASTIFSGMSLLSGLIGLILLFVGVNAEIAELEELTGAAVVPGWYLPAAALFALAQAGLAVLVIVKLTNPQVSAWFAAKKVARHAAR